MVSINEELKYIDYIKKHKSLVKQAFLWFKDRNLIDGDILSIAESNIERHDNSKHIRYEFYPYCDYFYGEKTEKVKEAFNYAWLHHIHHNPHHWQYWVLINDEDGTKALDMPEEYVIEMICDWWAFSWKSGNLSEIFNWYDLHKDNILISDKTRDLINKYLSLIREGLNINDRGNSEDSES